MRNRPDARYLSRSTSFGVCRECQRSWNSCSSAQRSPAPSSHTQGVKRHAPVSTLTPPSSSFGLTSFQNTIRNCPSFNVRVTSTSPSASSSSIACGASFHDSFNARTDMPPPLRVCRWISVNNSALERKLNSCFAFQLGAAGDNHDEHVLRRNTNLFWDPSVRGHAL
jgi:hypothetical protein